MSQANGLERREPNRGTSRQLEANIRHQKEQADIRLRCHVTYTLLSIFGVNTLAVLTFILLVGIGSMTLDIKVILSLIAETVAHAAGMFYLVTRYLFPGQSG
jgi:hypothetical protein